MKSPRHENRYDTIANTEWDVCFLTDSRDSNSLGRVFSLWLLATQLNYKCIVIAGSGVSTWGPLAGTAFDSVIAQSDSVSPGRWRHVVSKSRVVVCVKLLPWQLKCSRELLGRGFDRLIFDVDEPDAEAGLSLDNPLKHFVKSVLNPDESRLFRWALASVPNCKNVFVSNPSLLAHYGGVVLPHVRREVLQDAVSKSSPSTVAFVGTNRTHKGVPLLRRAVERVREEHDLRLVVTDSRPADAAPWEEWTGPTTLSEGLDIVRRATVVVVPSARTMFSEGQLPVKLIDAMMMGKVIVASDLPPIRWALDGSGVLFEPGDLNALTAGLVRALSSDGRETLEARARSRFAARFSVDANTNVFRSMIETVSRGTDA